MSAEGKPRNVYGISRDLWDHPAFAREAYTEAQACAWLIGAAAWRDGMTRGANRTAIMLRRGEFSFALVFLAERFQWSKSAVDRFINKLLKHDILRESSRESQKVYSFNNYNDYQIVGVPKRETTGKLAGKEREQEETVKQLNSKKGGADAPDGLGLNFQFPSWWPKAEWDAFLQMRKKKNVPMTDRARDLIIADLTRHRSAGQDPGGILDQSIRKGWTDVYPLKGAQGGQGAPVAANGAGEGDIATDLWVWRLRAFFEGDEGKMVAPGYWLKEWGPNPRQGGCKAPQDAVRLYRARNPEKPGPAPAMT